MKSDSLVTVLAENSPASFFIYRGKNMGFEYELLHEFARDLEVRLKVLIVSDRDELLGKLDSCKGDFVACNLTVTPERKQFVDFTNPHMVTRQVLIQRNHGDSLLKEIRDLNEKTVHVWRNSVHYHNLVQLNEEHGLNLAIVATDGDLVTGDLIRKVSEGEIDYTVTDENVALIHERFYNNLSVELVLRDEGQIAFAVRKGATGLRDTFNEWLADKKNASTIGEVRRKYFERKSLANKANDEYSSVVPEGSLTPFDEILKREAMLVGWDWRLIAAVMYQESKFVDHKISWAGAFGLFQFMPETAAQYGLTDSSSAEAQIHAACRKLSANYNEWRAEIPDTLQCMKFTLASFNAGKGHIDDARALCDVHGLDKTRWDENAEDMLLNLSHPEYYRDPVVRNGFCGGIETWKFPIEVLHRYEEYRAAFN